MKYEYIGHGKTREDAAADAVRGLPPPLQRTDSERLFRQIFTRKLLPSRKRKY